MSVKPLALLRVATKVAGMLALSFPHAAHAANINSQVPTDALLEFCSTQPADSETRAKFIATDGTEIVGTVECDSHDLQELANGGSDDTPGVEGDDDGTPDQGGANEDDANEDANDDNGGDDSSDDSGDDSSDDSSDDSEDSGDDSSDDSGDDSSDDEGDDD